MQTAVRSALAALPPHLAEFLLAAYLVGVAALLAWLFQGIALVRRWVARGEVVTGEASWAPVLEPLAAGIGRRVGLVVTPRVRVPMVWMPLLARRATVLLPEAARGWTRAQRRDTLVHELAHVERLDGPVQLAARLVCVAYWFHPLAWVALARLRLEAERACDDRVLATGSASCDYAERLVALARGAVRLRPRVAVAQATVALSGRQQLARRVHALLDAGRRRVPAGPLATALLAAAVLLPALALAPVRLVEAAGAGGAGPFGGMDAALAEESAAAGAEVDGLPRGDATPLMIAARHGHLEVARRLVDAGADVGIAVRGDGTPLIEAVRGGDQRVIDLLLERGADPAVGVPGDGNPLIWAVVQGDRELVQRLVDLGADPDTWVAGDESAFFHAVESGDGEMVALLLDAGADPDPDFDTDTDHDVDVDLVVPGDETALIQAAGHGHLATVRYLVERGADLNLGVDVDLWRGGREVRTPLSQARRGGHDDVLRYLRSQGARR